MLPLLRSLFFSGQCRSKITTTTKDSRHMKIKTEAQARAAINAGSMAEVIR
jgi:hypothetical protein